MFRVARVCVVSLVNGSFCLPISFPRVRVPVQLIISPFRVFIPVLPALLPACCRLLSGTFLGWPSQRFGRVGSVVALLTVLASFPSVRYAPCSSSTRTGVHLPARVGCSSCPRSVPVMACDGSRSSSMKGRSCGDFSSGFFAFFVSGTLGSDLISTGSMIIARSIHLYSSSAARLATASDLRSPAWFARSGSRSMRRRKFPGGGTSPLVPLSNRVPLAGSTSVHD
jgi:hypothetical protein